MSDLLATLDAVPRELVPAAITRLAARLMAAPEQPANDQMLTPDEAARLLRTTRRFVYRNARALGAIRLSERQLRFPRQAVLRFIKRRADP